MDTETRLAEIAALVRAGAKYGTFQEEIDTLLGTSLSERSTAAEAVYENQRGLNDD